MVSRPRIRYDTDFIYVIVNEVNGRRYVGRTVHQVRKRWAIHQSELRGNRHQNKLLQADWNRDGQDAFTVEVIDRVRDYGNQAEEALTLRYYEVGIPLYNRVAGARPFPRRRPLSIQPGDILEYMPDQEPVE